MIPQEAKLTHIKILAQIQLNYLSDFRANSEKEKWFVGTFKNFVKTFIGKLVEVEGKFFDKAISKEEEATEVCYDVMDTFIQAVSSVPIWEQQNIITIINAYNMDKDSIEGICRKILKNAK